MEEFNTVAGLRAYLAERRPLGPVGLVPTMGYFHEGHLSLMRRSVQESATTVVSLYVNPLQFGPDEDLAAYPKDLARDRSLAARQGVDALFVPTDDEMYPKGPEKHLTVVQVRQLEDRLEGASRPGHFQGVATVVTQLLNIVQPDAAYFGLKDYQQTVVIRQLVRDLHMNVELAMCPTVREEGGLALSSRNTYLNDQERQAATILYRTLHWARKQIEAGERNPRALEAAMVDYIEQNEPLAKVDYGAVRAAGTLERLETIGGPVVLLLAVFVGPARLIDNLVVTAAPE